jgi:prepilin-type N-terminal cleavage/methylation domain-containing protein
MNSVPKHIALRTAGFTLIELSIVLVIIGLIVGGVLVGQDLIKAAEIRATVGQWEKYNSAVNTFRTKYNGIPGDIAVSQATAFGLFGLTTAGTVGGAGEGDGNGLLEGGSSGATVALGETLLFWRHLSDAGLVDGSFGANLTTAGQAAADVTGSTIANYLPPAKVGRGNYFAVAAANGINYYLLTGFAGTAITATTGVYNFGFPELTPIEAYNIDVKVDDGMPNTGIVQARGANPAAAFLDFTTSSAGGSTWGATSSPNNCIMGAAGATDPSDTYNRTSANGSGTTPAGLLRLRFN